MGLKSDRRKPNKNKIWKKKIIPKKKNAIKRIRTKLERLKISKGVKLKIIYNMIDYL
jgi:vacuolar-type H+-ATPase subunit D/Vma8